MSAGRALARSVYLVFLFGLPLAPVLAAAHAYLVKATPAHRAVLFQAPERVQLWFNERLEAQFSRLSVWDGQGKQVDLGDAQVGPDDPTKLSVRVAISPPGSTRSGSGSSPWTATSSRASFPSRSAGASESLASLAFFPHPAPFGVWLPCGTCPVPTRVRKGDHTTLDPPQG